MNTAQHLMDKHERAGVPSYPSRGPSRTQLEPSISDKIHQFIDDNQTGLHEGLKLRTRQIDYLDAAADFFKKGEHAPLGQVTSGWVKAPTGFGKTVAFFSTIVAADLPSIILVHSEELVEQTAREFERRFPNAEKISKYYGGEKGPIDAKVIVCTYDSLDSYNRAAKEHGIKRPLVICDESHHSLTEIRRSSISEIDGTQYRIAFTATPEYNEQKSLAKEKNYEHFIYGVSLAELIEDQTLAGVVCFRVKTNTNIQGVNLNDSAAVSKAVNVIGRNLSAVELMKDQRFKGRSKAAFCVDIEHAESLLALCNENQISAVIVHSGLDKDQRKKNLREYEEGKYEVVIAVDTLNEGWDCPRAEILFNLRPTKSVVLAEQRLGRLLRPFSAVDDCFSYIELNKEKNSPLVAVCEDEKQAQELAERSIKLSKQCFIITEKTDPTFRQEAEAKVQRGEPLLLCYAGIKSDELPIIAADYLFLSRKSYNEINSDSSDAELTALRTHLANTKDQSEVVSGKEFAIVFDFVDRGSDPEMVLASDIIGGTAILPASAASSLERVFAEKDIKKIRFNLSVQGVTVVSDIEELTSQYRGESLAQKRFENRDQVIAILHENGISDVTNLAVANKGEFLASKLYVAQSVENGRLVHPAYKGSIGTLLNRFCREVMGVEPPNKPQELLELVSVNLWNEAALRSYREHLAARANKANFITVANLALYNDAKDLLNVPLKISQGNSTVTVLELLTAGLRGLNIKEEEIRSDPDRAFDALARKLSDSDERYRYYLMCKELNKSVRNACLNQDLLRAIKETPDIDSYSSQRFKNTTFNGIRGALILKALLVYDFKAFIAEIQSSEQLVETTRKRISSLTDSGNLYRATGRMLGDTRAHNKNTGVGYEAADKSSAIAARGLDYTNLDSESPPPESRQVSANTIYSLIDQAYDSIDELEYGVLIEPKDIFLARYQLLMFCCESSKWSFGEDPNAKELAAAIDKLHLTVKEALNLATETRFLKNDQIGLLIEIGQHQAEIVLEVSNADGGTICSLNLTAPNTDPVNPQDSEIAQFKQTLTAVSEAFNTKAALTSLEQIELARTIQPIIPVVWLVEPLTESYSSQSASDQPAFSYSLEGLIQLPLACSALTGVSLPNTRRGKALAFLARHSDELRSNYLAAKELLAKDSSLSPELRRYFSTWLNEEITRAYIAPENAKDNNSSVIDFKERLMELVELLKGTPTNYKACCIVLKSCADRIHTNNIHHRDINTFFQLANEINSLPVSDERTNLLKRCEDKLVSMINSGITIAHDERPQLDKELNVFAIISKLRTLVYSIDRDLKAFKAEQEAQTRALAALSSVTRSEVTRPIDAVIKKQRTSAIFFYTQNGSLVAWLDKLSKLHTNHRCKELEATVNSQDGIDYVDRVELPNPEAISDKTCCKSCVPKGRALSGVFNVGNDVKLKAIWWPLNQ